MPAALKSTITGLVSGIEPSDDLGREHRRNVLSWLAGTDDIFRRAKPTGSNPICCAPWTRSGSAADGVARA